MPPIVQHRRGTLAALTAANEVPSAGEIYFETDTNRLKVGDGVTTYVALPYIVGGSGGAGVSANNAVFDNLTFNGTTTTFTLAIGGVPVSPASAASVLVSISGVVQQPLTTYTISGSQITFAAAPASSDAFFGIHLAGASTSLFSPAQLTAHQNDYSLPTGVTFVRLSSDATRTITGFVGQAGSLTLANVGSNSIQITHQDTSSAAANRVISPTGATITLGPNDLITLVYDSTTGRWRGGSVITLAVITSTAASWWAGTADKTKLDGIAPAATANATDAQLRDRSTHTGTQAIATVSGLQAELDGKQPAGSYAAAVHQHTIAQVTGLQASLDSKQPAGSYAAAVHQHVIADTAGLQAALDGKQASGSYAAASHTHSISAVTGLQAALDNKQEIGVYATLVNGKVPAGQLPSYVDDVLEYDTRPQFPASGEEGKLYITIDTKKLYRWSGTTYVEIVGSPGSSDAIVEGSTNLYFTATRAVSAVQSLLDGKAALVHSHVVGDVTGLQAALDSKQPSGSYAASVHSHVVADISGLQTALDNRSLTGHAHTASAITDFASAVVAAAPPTTDASLLTGGTLSDSRLSANVVFTTDARLSDARTPLSHSHSASDVTSGVFDTARFASSGVASSTTFLRGDGTWASAGSTSASDLTSGTLAFDRLPDEVEAATDLYLWSSFR